MARPFRSLWPFLLASLWRDFRPLPTLCRSGCGLNSAEHGGSGSWRHSSLGVKDSFVDPPSSMGGHGDLVGFVSSDWAGDENSGSYVYHQQTLPLVDQIALACEGGFVCTNVSGGFREALKSGGGGALKVFLVADRGTEGL